ncbi:MAG TPA: PAS domain S-box protein [Candidatus Nanoarchaeia archaeon]|nr:PAS domain S-box protein [Candidatus Nanoarchaeia archaeon]
MAVNRSSGKRGSGKDITERNQEEVLRESEEKYGRMFDEALDAIFIADAKTGIIIDCNLAACELVGRKKPELIGKHQRILHPPLDIKGEFSRTFRQHIDGKKGQVLEARVITKKGEIKDVAIKASIFKLKDKRFIQGIFRDITEQKKAEEAILRANMFNSALIESAPFGIITVRQDGLVDYVNPTMLELSGATYNHFKKMNVFRLPTYVKMGLSDKVRKCFKGASFFIGPVEYVSHFSRKRTVRNFTGMPMRDENGSIEKVMLFVEDLTEIKEAEEKLRESEERFRAIFEGATDGILVADTKTKRFVFANPGICELTGYSSNELFKLSVGDIHPAKDLPYVMAQVARQIKGEITLASNIPVLRKNKQVVYCDVNSKVMKIGVQEYLVGFFRDVTERKKADEELKKRTEELEKFNQLAVGRELRMVELKKRIKELEKKEPEEAALKRK